MKQVFFLIILVAIVGHGFSSNSVPFPKSNYSLAVVPNFKDTIPTEEAKGAEYYYKKGKHQNTGAWLVLIGGTIITCVVAASESGDGDSFDDLMDPAWWNAPPSKPEKESDVALYIFLGTIAGAAVLFL